MTQILLVEDNPDNADLVCALLGDDHDITVVTSGKQALAWLGNNTGPLPNLLLLDISLPEMDGTELLRRLRSDTRFAVIPAIALTAHAMKDDRNRLLAVGFDEYISKPIDETLLNAAIDKLTATCHADH